MDTLQEILKSPDFPMKENIEDKDLLSTYENDIAEAIATAAGIDTYNKGAK